MSCRIVQTLYQIFSNFQRIEQCETCIHSLSIKPHPQVKTMDPEHTVLSQYSRRHVSTDPTQTHTLDQYSQNPKCTKCEDFFFLGETSRRHLISDLKAGRIDQEEQIVHWRS